MNRTLLGGIAGFLAMVGVALVGGESKAVAGHGCHGCASCYDCSGWACDGCYGGWRSCRGVYRHRAFWRCHGCSGCYSSSSCYDGWSCQGGSGCYGSEPVIDRPTEEPAPTPAADESAASRQGTLDVQVPANARLLINGRVTQSTGSSRRYVSNDLLPGQKYEYELQAEVTVDGVPVRRTQVVTLEAGRRAEVSFDFGTTPSARLATRVVRP